MQETQTQHKKFMRRKITQNDRVQYNIITKEYTTQIYSVGEIHNTQCTTQTYREKYTKQKQNTQYVVEKDTI